jgi:hypothetical protein
MTFVVIKYTMTRYITAKQHFFLLLFFRKFNTENLQTYIQNKKRTI